jgi:SAM-dependent methyltransferase
VLEIAVGEGTFSRRLFGDTHSITAVDLSPYSLVKAVHLPHISQAVICDGLNPPFAAGSYDLLISNNFLHHVTQKRFALSNWARVARLIVFNENTTTWATGWPLPYLLSQFGLRNAARRAALSIERRSLQSLLGIQALDAIVESVVSVTERQSFLSERTFFYCGLFSLVLRCYGPPTPALFKRLALGPFRSISLGATRGLAKLLILFDAAQDRSCDAFVEFICKGHPPFEARATQFVCPSCGAGLGSHPTSCTECGATFPTRDGLLFVLPNELRQVLDEYSSEAAASIPREHL